MLVIIMLVIDAVLNVFAPVAGQCQLEKVDQGVPEGTSSQDLRSTPVDS